MEKGKCLRRLYDEAFVPYWATVAAIWPPIFHCQHQTELNPAKKVKIVFKTLLKIKDVEL